MIVKELVKKLREVDQELEVDVEGCDCIQKALSVIVYGKIEGRNRTQTVLITTGSEVLDEEELKG